MDTVCTCTRRHFLRRIAKRGAFVLACLRACLVFYHQGFAGFGGAEGLRGAGVDLSETGGHVALSPTSSFRVPSVCGFEIGARER